MSESTSRGMDVKVIMRQALEHHQAGRLQEAQFLYRMALQARPNHPDANHNLGVLAMQQHQPAEALGHLKAALESDPAQGQYWLSYVAALTQAGQMDAARQVLAQARERGLAGPQVEDLARRLGVGAAPAVGTGDGAGPMRAEVDQLVGLFGQERYAEAEQLARVLTQRDPPNGLAFRALGVALKGLGRFEEALDSLLKAAALQPADPDLQVDLGLVFQAVGSLSDAERSFDRAIELRPEFAEAYYDLASVLLEQGRFPESEEGFRRAIAINADFAEAHNNLGALLRIQGRLSEAEACFLHALKSRPNYAEAHGNLGSVLHGLGRLREGEAHFGQALNLRPDYADAYFGLGNILNDQCQFSEAEAMYRAALGIRPDWAEAHTNLGGVLEDLGRLTEAEVCHRRALEIHPDLAEAHVNLGGILWRRGQPAEAEALFRRAVQLQPNSAVAHSNLGTVLMEHGFIENALASYRRALELDRNYAEAHNNLGLALNAQGRHAEAEASCRRALALKPDLAEAWSNLLFALNYDAKRGAEEIQQLHREYDERFGVPLRAVWCAHDNSREPGRRLKVGYVSPDFRAHAVAKFLEPLLAKHDKAVVEVYAYAEVKREDAVSARLKGYVDHWVRTVGLSDEALAERIRTDGIDILVDLAGHTAGNRLLVFARKPAPIQMTWLGYPGSSGLSAMDYRLSDGCADPQGSEAYYTEKLLRLPGSLWCYRPREDMPEVTALPAQQNGYVTFGSFNNFNKINSRCIELWAQLLRAVPNARLLMVTIPEGEPRQRLAEQCVALGVSAERLEFRGELPGPEFFRMIQRADIALDPVTVNGATTTCECLWLGLPVLTLVGERFLQRAGLSILSAAGFSEFAAATPQGCIDIATRLARDLPRLAEIRARMRPQMAASALMDEVRFARNVEKVYRQVWTEWCHAAS